jgi:SAM-dependent methyltransferase
MDHSLRALPFEEARSSGIAWEETDCLLCRGDNWSPLVEAPDRTPTGEGQWFMVVQCRDCGLCFTNPRPTADSIGQFYRSDYKPHQPHESSGGALRWWQRLPWPARWQNWRKSLRRHGEGRLLDFGCGSGSFLDRMRRQGWKVVGIDASSEAAQQARDRLGIPVLAGTLPHPDLLEETFDVVTMWQSLEHVHEPLEALRAAYQVLAPAGKLIVAVPNIDSMPFRWFGQTWFSLDLPRHLTHFAPWTLRLMLHRAGFRRIRLRQAPRSAWLRASARLACRTHPHATFWHRWLQTRAGSQLASWYSHLTRQTDCLLAEAIKM